jgi:hypothetical protein
MQGILTPQFLTESYTKISSASLRNPFFEFYDAAPKRNEDGDILEIVTYGDDRKPAPTNARGASARTLDTKGASKAYFSPIHMYNEVTLPMAAVENLRQADNPAKQEKGAEEIRRQFDLFGRRHRITKAAALAKLLGDGVAYFDVNGQLLENSTGAATTVDLGVAASHKTQLNHSSLGSNIVNTTWSNAGANILQDLEQIREAAEYDQAPMPKHVWLHTVAKAWIRANTDLKTYAILNSPQAEQFFNGLPADTLQVGDWTFHFYNGTYEDSAGNIVPFVSKTKAIITPDVNDGTWFRSIAGSEVIATGEGISNSIDQALAQTTTVYGDFSYLAVKHNPLKVSLFMGSNFLYAFADPNAVWMPTVDF